jgi:hypothetical protein
MAAKLTRPSHKIATQLHLVAESCNICSSRSRQPIWKVLDTPSYVICLVLCVSRIRPSGLLRFRISSATMNPFRCFGRTLWTGSWGGSVSIGPRLGAGRPGFVSRQGLEIFLLATASRPALGPTQPPIKWIPGILSPGLKRQRREADHSPPSSAEVKNVWRYTSTLPIRLHGVVLN